MTVLKPASLVALASALCTFTLPAASAPADYGFTVDITLSPKAAAKLQAKHEGIKVLAMYEGEPIPSKIKKADEMGQIGLGNEDVTLPGEAGRATVTGTKVERAHVGWVKELQVLINVVSARRTSPDNLLDCGIFEDSVAKAQQKPIAIHCKLIGEP